MARQPLDPPSQFGKLVSSAIRREMGDRRMSGRELARHLGKSEAYVRERLKDKFEFTLGDVENFSHHVGQEPEAFIGAIERRDEDHPRREGNVTQLRQRDVAPSAEDHIDLAPAPTLPKVAKKRPVEENND